MRELAHRRWVTTAAVALLGVVPWACSDEGTGGAGGSTCDVERQTGCPAGLVCEEVEGAAPDCFAPISVKGRVFDFLDQGAIEGARVLARDENGAALSTVVLSGPDGTYDLPVPAKRSADGTPVKRSFTLRADAAGYQSFPTAPRVALPLDLADATGAPLVLQQANSDIGLMPLPDTTGLGSVSGVVESDLPGGTLIDAGGHTGVADREGHFQVFNVPAGSVVVAGYKQGLNIDSVTAAVTAASDTSGLVLKANAKPASKVSGSVQVVDPMGAQDTSVILVLEDTFDPDVIRGEAPPGLRAANVSGAFSIEGVPDGAYVVLAGFENDGLVRDPDTSIGGTEIVHIVVAGADQSLAQSFKVTGALDVLSPGAEGIENVADPITFSWEDDSSEDAYHVQVFDAFGTLTWETTGDFDQGGNKPAEVAYGGPPLLPGMLYQFRATSMKMGAPLSSTEDLKGVFVHE